MYDDKEPWNDDAKDLKVDKPEEGSSPKDSAKKSNLLSAYFSSEKTKVAEEKKEQKLQAREEEAIAKKYVTSKVDELDKEIKRLKVDRDHVKAKERKLEEEKRKLAKEKEELEAFVKNEKAKIEEYKEQELKKVQNQKKIAERNQKAVMNMPNRKEREEIEALKEKLTKSAEEHNSKEKKLKITIERQKKQIEELLKRNKELEEEVHLLEQMRLKAGGEEKSKVAFKSGPKKNSLEDSGFGGAMVNQRKSSGAEKPKKSAKTSLKSAASNFIEETDDLEDFQRAEDEAVEEVQEMDRSNMVEIDEDNGSQNLGEKGDQQFRMAINPDEYAYSANKFYQEYIQAKSKSKIRLTEERQPKLLATGSDNGKAERKYEDGRVEVTFKNGAIRETFPNGYVIVNYTIGDIKQTLPDGSIIYYYSDQDTTQITLPDNGLNVTLYLI